MVVGSVLLYSVILVCSLYLFLIVNVLQLFSCIVDGDVLIIDGVDGSIIVNLQVDNLWDYCVWLKEYVCEQCEFGCLCSKFSCICDQVDIVLLVNVELLEDVIQVYVLGVQGFGLYCIEFLFLQCNELLDEEEQFQIYCDVVLGMSGWLVIICMLDLGVDKVDCIGLILSNEENFVFGLCGVCFLLVWLKVVDIQLCVILCVFVYGKLCVLVLMVSICEELLVVCWCMFKLIEQLCGEGYMVFDYVLLGVMIEVFVVVLVLESFIDLVDFLLIGINDLVQYLLVVDCNNEVLGELYLLLYFVVLWLLQMVIEIGVCYCVLVVVCGEMVGDVWMILLLLVLGLSEFSLYFGMLLEVCCVICDVDLGVLCVCVLKLLVVCDCCVIECWLVLVVEMV